MPQEYGIDFSNSEVHECGATLVTLLAIPKDDEEDSARGRLHASLCALALRARYEDSAVEHLPQLMKPIHAFRKDKDIGRDLRTLRRRLRDRMVAARMAIGFLQEVELGRLPPLPRAIERLSVNQLSELVLEDAGQTDPENVETRIWRPSLPVIHLAAATAVMIDVFERAGFQGLSFAHVMTQRPLIEAIVREAQRYEELLPQSTRLRIDPQMLVKVRLIGC